jgi:Glu-tRNA(Gln) amidotransferase subunit E-like FAD-binding protein
MNQEIDQTGDPASLETRICKRRVKKGIEIPSPDAQFIEGIIEALCRSRINTDKIRSVVKIIISIRARQAEAAARKSKEEQEATEEAIRRICQDDEEEQKRRTNEQIDAYNKYLLYLMKALGGSLSDAQLEIIRAAFRDGISAEQVAAKLRSLPSPP